MNNNLNFLSSSVKAYHSSLSSRHPHLWQHQFKVPSTHQFFILILSKSTAIQTFNSRHPYSSSNNIVHILLPSAIHHSKFSSRYDCSQQQYFKISSCLHLNNDTDFLSLFTSLHLSSKHPHSNDQRFKLSIPHYFIILIFLQDILAYNNSVSPSAIQYFSITANSPQNAGGLQFWAFCKDPQTTDAEAKLSHKIPPPLKLVGGVRVPVSRRTLHVWTAAWIFHMCSYLGRTVTCTCLLSRLIVSFRTGSLTS